MRLVSKGSRMHPAVILEFTEAINATVYAAVDEVVKDYLTTLDDYLEALDKGTFEYLCSDDVLVKFTPEHQVIVRIPIVTSEGYTWAFRGTLNNYIEVEADGTFEQRLS